MAKHDTLDNRPQCSVPDCTNGASHMLGKTHKNYPSWRRAGWIIEQYPYYDGEEAFCCNSCHAANTARKNGVSSAGALTKLRTAEAKKRGFKSIKANRGNDG